MKTFNGVRMTKDQYAVLREYVVASEHTEMEEAKAALIAASKSDGWKKNEYAMPVEMGMVTLYRGTTPLSDKAGFSWTQDKHVAEFFATHQGVGALHTLSMTFKEARDVCVFCDEITMEMEVMLDLSSAPSLLDSITTEEVDPRPAHLEGATTTEYLEAVGSEYYQEYLDQF